MPAGKMRLLPESPPSSNIEEIKSWFNTTVLPVTLSGGANHREGAGAGKLVLWDKAVTYSLDKDRIFEMPLASEVQKNYLLSSLSSASRETNSRKKAGGDISRFVAQRYVVVTQHKDGKKDYAVMSVVPDDAEGNRHENGHYKKMGNRFSGMVLFHTWEGTFMNGWIYEKGKIVKSIMPAPGEEESDRVISESKDHRNYGPAVALASDGNYSPGENCSTEFVNEYCHDCTDWYVNGEYSDTHCGDSYVCGVQSVEVCSANGDGLQPLGDGSGGGGGGGSDGGYIPPDPTSNLPELSEEQLIAFDRNINIDSLAKCTADIFNILQAIRTGEFGRIIDNFSGIIPSFKWNLQIGSVNSNANAETSAMPMKGTVTTNFNKSYLYHATDLSIARTMLHEAVHAWLVDYFRYDPVKAKLTYPQLVQEYLKAKHPDWEVIQHNEIVRDFISDIASNLQSYGLASGYIIDKQFYNDMAWGGLEQTQAFKNLPFADQERIHARIESERQDAPYQLSNGSYIFPKGQRRCK